MEVGQLASEKFAAPPPGEDIMRLEVTLVNGAAELERSKRGAEATAGKSIDKNRGQLSYFSMLDFSGNDWTNTPIQTE